jgi:23S rRNA (uracil1939-C5)-methyltransferase
VSSLPRDIHLDSLRVVCDHADRCAGCPLIDLPYGTQLSAKRGRVVEAMIGYPALELAYVQATLPADPITSYRTRAKLVVAQREEGPGVLVGLYGSGGGHVVIDTPSCRVVSKAITEVVAMVREMSQDPRFIFGRVTPIVPGRAAQTIVRALDVRETRGTGGTGGDEDAHALVTFVALRDDVRTPELIEEFRASARELRARLPRVLGVALNLREGESPQILGSEVMHLDGDTTAIDRIGNVSHIATFGAFVQAHRGQARRVHDMLIEKLAIGSGRRILDLYGGSGAIGLALAARGADVHLVESFAPAAKFATEGARALPKTAGHLEATAGEVSEVLMRLVRQAQAQNKEQAPPPSQSQSPPTLPMGSGSGYSSSTMRAVLPTGAAGYDAVVLNPPRRGVAPLVREQIAQLRPRVIGYVSCDPETLARDLDHFVRLGYAPTTLQPLDMIPLTEEVETVAILEVAPTPLPRVAYSDDEVVIVEKPAHEPTTPQGEYAGSLLQRVRRLPGAENAVPVHRLDVGTSGLVIFARKAAFVTAWAEALGAPTGRKIYLAAARGRTPSKGAITRDLRDEGRLLPARTRYRWLGGAGGHSVLRVIPEQGRTHQIRRHLAAIGHPVLGDERYGHAPTNRFFEEKHGLDRTFLHCVRLELTHPRTGVRLLVETPLPGDLRLSLMRCGGPNVLKFLEGKAALGGDQPSTLPPPPPGSQYPSSSQLPISSRTDGGPQSSSRDSAPGSVSRLSLDSERTSLGDAPDVDRSPMSIRPPITSTDDD